MDNYKEILNQGLFKNIVVFDSQAKPDEFTPRLLELMLEVSWPTTITDIHVRETRLDYDKINGRVDWWFYPNSFWDEVEKFYLKELNGQYHSHDKNLVIGISKSQPLFSKENPVLLGSY